MMVSISTIDVGGPQGDIKNDVSASTGIHTFGEINAT